MSRNSTEVIREGISRLYQYLTTIVISAAISVAIILILIYYLEFCLKTATPVNLLSVLACVVITFIAWFIPQLLYYDAIDTLVKWSNRFILYKYLIFMYIVILISQKALLAYQACSVISEYNTSLTSESTTTKVVIDILTPFEFSSTYEFIVSCIFNIALFGVFIAIRDEFEHLQVDNSKSKKPGICEARESTMYLRISQGHLLIGALFAYIHYLNNRFSGILVLGIGIVLIIIGAFKTMDVLFDMEKYIRTTQTKQKI